MAAWLMVSLKTQTLGPKAGTFASGQAGEDAAALAATGPAGVATAALAPGRGQGEPGAGQHHRRRRQQEPASQPAAGRAAADAARGPDLGKITVAGGTHHEFLLVCPAEPGPCYRDRRPYSLSRQGRRCVIDSEPGTSLASLDPVRGRALEGGGAR